jgi:hypothetical protein
MSGQPRKPAQRTYQHRLSQPGDKSLAPIQLATDEDLERNLRHWAREFDQEFRARRLSTHVLDQLELLFDAQRSEWLAAAYSGFEKYSRLRPDTFAYEHAKAFDAWGSISVYWMEFAPASHAPLIRMLFDYLRICEAPLPDSYSSARRGLKYKIGRVSAALDRNSTMSPGWRLHWLSSYPGIHAALLRYGSPREQRKRRRPAS